MTPLSPVDFLRRAGDVWPQAPAVSDVSGARLTYAELRGRADRLADAIRGAGVERGERVAVLAHNGHVLLESHFGVPGAGAVLVALNTRLGPDEYAYILEHSESRVLIVDPAHLPMIESILPALSTQPAIVLIGRDYESWLSGSSGPGMQPPDEENDLIAINYTSGTTGTPKGVMYTHRGAFLNALGDTLTFRLGPESVYLWTLPMFHCNGWCFTWAITAAGAHHVCLPRPEPAQVLAAIAEYRVTHLCGAPVVISSLATHPQAGQARFPWGVRAAVGGAPPAPQVIENAERMGMEILHLYGMTETYGPSLVCEPQGDWAAEPLRRRAELSARQGVRTAVVRQVRVVDPAGEDVPRDGATLGEIIVDSATVMAGYFRDEAATAESLRGGWLHTGDLAVMHADGYIEIRDRAKDIIISGGENISSVEVEHVLLDHPGVADAAVVAVPDERWGEVPVAFVTRAQGSEVSEEELIEHVRSRLARFKSPRRITFTDLPRTATGKVQKGVLRERGRSAHRD
ncbi:MAG: long-chain-fatty-acid--CoA ligase [Actinomycetales bacterium]|nr:long-chain-fatty-acid--CoA ligase [Actinomycetales bacterium]